MSSFIDILAFAPHPDDAELGCGGSLIMASSQGTRTAVADLTRAEHSTRGNPGLRQEETLSATQHLNLSQRFNLGLPDTEIGSHSSHRSKLIELIRETRPGIVLAPYWEDKHPDHAAAGKLVREAFFLSGVSKVGEGEPYRPKHLYHYMLHYPFTPSFVIDISSAWEEKLAAIKAFSSQFGETDGGNNSRPSLLRYLQGRAIYFGAMIGAAYGEAYYSAGPVPLQGFPAIGDDQLSTDGSSSYSVYSP